MNAFEFDLFTTIADVKRKVKDRLETGDAFSCPACGQTCKIYKRKLNAMQAHFLVWLVQRYEQLRDWIDVPKEYPHKIGGEYGKLRHWSLAELHPNDDDTKRTSGLWRPTALAVDFVYDRITVPKYVYLYNNEIHSISPDRIGIREALGDKFDYAEIMQPYNQGERA